MQYNMHSCSALFEDMFVDLFVDMFVKMLVM